MTGGKFWWGSIRTCFIPFINALVSPEKNSNAVVRQFASRSTRSRLSIPRRRGRVSIIAVVAFYLSTAVAGGAFLSDKLLSRVKEEYGRGAERSLVRWQKFVLKHEDKSEERKLELVNRYFNVIPYASDSKQWGVKDYWSTPVELLVHDRGDCEDYAIAKYFTLRKLGVPAEKLRVLYVHVTDGSSQSRIGNGLNANLSHMVLGYYETPTSTPLILDNLTRHIQPASERTDLKPIFSLDSDELMLSMIRERGADIKYRDGSEQWYAFMLRI